LQHYEQLGESRLALPPWRPQRARRTGSKWGSGQWSHWDEIGWVHCLEILQPVHIVLPYEAILRTVTHWSRRSALRSGASIFLVTPV
jgi:hypothetical protein